MNKTQQSPTSCAAHARTRNSLLTLTAAFALAFSASCHELDAQQTLSRINVELKSPSPDFVLAKGTASVENGQLKVDSRESSNTWNFCFKTTPGLLKPDTSYIVTAKCRILEKKEGYVYLLIRPFEAKDHYLDIGNAICTESGVDRVASIKFRVPPKAKDYVFQIYANQKVLALIDSISISERQGSVQPISSENPPAVMPVSLPTGAPEFKIERPKSTGGECVSAERFGVTEGNPDNAKAFLDAIDYCSKAGAAKLTVPKGIYRFASDVPIHFEKIKDFELDGQGSTFVFLKKNGPLLLISNCERTIFKDFNIDWDWDKDPIASFVKTEAIGPNGSFADFRFINHENFPRRDLRVALLDLVDPITMSVGCNEGFSIYLEFVKGKNAPDIEWLSGNLLRVRANKSFHGFPHRLAVGQLFRMSHYYYDMNGIEMRSNSHLTLSGINVYSCPGHAFLSSGKQHHWQFLNTNIIKPPGKSERPITCAADHHHIAQSLGYFKMEGCEFSYGNDDGLNVHDTSDIGLKISEKAISSRRKVEAGETVELRNDDYSPTGFTAKVKETGKSESADYPFSIAFDKPVPEPKGARFIIFNRAYGSENVIVRNCYFHDNRAHGMLIHTNNVTIEGSRFLRNQMGAIKIETGYTLKSWCEGYGASNILIKGNTFENVNPHGCYLNEQCPAIYIYTYIGRDPSPEKTTYPILHDILITGNKFIECPGAIVNASSAKNVFIMENSVVNDVPRMRDLPYRGSIVTSFASNIFVSGNTWKASPLMPRVSILSDPETSKDIFCWGNKIVDAPR